jgi:hypothetical protein
MCKHGAGCLYGDVYSSSEYPMSDDDFRAYKVERMAELPDDLKEKIVSLLREKIANDIPAIKAEIEKDPINWLAPYHFSWGMGVRNLIRQSGFSDALTPLKNWDDYYGGLVELAVL